MSKYLSRKEASDKLGVHYHTLYAMAERKEIEAIQIGKRQVYNVDKYLNQKGVIDESKRKKICYCRVSSAKQKEDLKRQVELMEQKYPGYEIIYDVASGLNFERAGLKKIIDYAFKNEIEHVIVAYKDRLARFGYELIEWIIKEYSKGEIIVMNKKEEETPTEELTKDIVSIMNVYTAKINGLRKYKKVIKEEINKKI